MNASMLDYDKFDLETVLEPGMNLDDAVSKADRLRREHPDVYIRIRDKGGDSFIVVQVKPEQVYQDWLSRLSRRFSRVLRALPR